MERAFFKINESYQAVKIISSSPEEAQQHDKVHPDSASWPTGWFLDCVRRVEGSRIVHYIGMAKVGERMTVPGNTDKPLPAAPVPRAVALPKVVEQADEKHLEVMAARNGIDVDSPVWKKRPVIAKRVDVAEAMRKVNAA